MTCIVSLVICLDLCQRLRASHRIDDEARSGLSGGPGVVYYQYVPEQHSTIGTVSKVALAGSNSEAIVPLYDESKVVATKNKVKLETKTLWSFEQGSADV
jgi:hypothetical protein